MDTQTIKILHREANGYHTTTGLSCECAPYVLSGQKGPWGDYVPYEVFIVEHNPSTHLDERETSF